MKGGLKATFCVDLAGVQMIRVYDYGLQKLFNKAIAGRIQFEQ